MKKMLSIFLCALLLLVPTSCQNAPTDAGGKSDLHYGYILEFSDTQATVLKEGQKISSLDLTRWTKS